MQWYQSRQGVDMKCRTAKMDTSNSQYHTDCHPREESDEELVQMQRETGYERGYMEKFDPNVTPESM
jgi:hypothetical protein